MKVSSVNFLFSRKGMKENEPVSLETKPSQSAQIAASSAIDMTDTQPILPTKIIDSCVLIS